MVSKIGNLATDSIQLMMSQMMQKMTTADADGSKGLSKSELSSIDTNDGSGGAAFLKSLSDQFDALDTNGNGELSANEITKAKSPLCTINLPEGFTLEPKSEDISDSSSTSTTDSTTSCCSNSNETIQDLIQKIMLKVTESLTNNTDSDKNKNEAENIFEAKTVKSLSSADTDGTKGLSKTELSSIDTSDGSGKSKFINNLIKNFDSLDANGNGQLSSGEILGSHNQNTLSFGQASGEFLSKLISNYNTNGLSSIASSIGMAG